jgi:hypothetical protein
MWLDFESQGPPPFDMDETEQEGMLGGTPPPGESTVPQAGESSPEPWTLRDLFLFLAFVPIGFFTANLLVMMGSALLRPALHAHLSRDKLAGDPFFLLALQGVFYALLFVYVYFMVAVMHTQPFWRMLRWRRIGWKSVLGCLAGGALLTVAIAVFPPLLPDANQFPLQDLFNSRAAAYAIGAFAILVAPFMEELIFRGVLFGVFESQIGLRSAILITAILFGGLHVPEYWGAWNHMFLLFLVGLVFSVARGKSGSLAPSVFLHMGYNGSMVLALFLSTQHFRHLSQ